MATKSVEKYSYKLYNIIYNGGGILTNKMTAKKRRRVVLTSILCFFIIGVSIISSVSNISKIREKTLEKKELVKQLEILKEEQKILSDDVEKLKNPEYAARYAREKYLYSKNGEKILKID